MPANRTTQPRNQPPQVHRRDNIVPETGHDAYRAVGRLPEPAVCERCTAVYHEGKWLWGKTPDGAHQVLCPACRRIEDRYPAGFLSLAGPYLSEHREEVLNLVRNEAEAELAEHPLNRIIAMEDVPGGIEITTTDIHLPRRVAEAIHDAHKGELGLDYAEDDTIVRIRWSR